MRSSRPLRSRRLVLAAVAVLAVLPGADAQTSVVGGAKPRPVPTTWQQNVWLVRQHLGTAQLDGDLLHALAFAYLGLMQDFTPENSLALLPELTAGCFGLPFEVGVSGFAAWGSSGDLDVSSFLLVEDLPTGSTAPLDDLELWPLDLEQPGIDPIPFPGGWDTPLEAYFYAATFGANEPTVGVATRFVFETQSELIFVPMVSVPAGGLMSASDAAAFLGMLAVGGFETTDFSDWALARFGAATAAMVGGAPKTSVACDGEAFDECVDAASTEADDAIDAAYADYRAVVDAALREAAEGKGWELAAWSAGGIVTGVLASAGSSALQGAPFGPAGAIAGGIAGFIGGAFAAIVSAAGDASVAKDKIDAAKAALDGELCSALSEYGQDLVGCALEFCPLGETAVQAVVDDMLDGAGC